jgi:hypothetical protein
MVHENLIPDLSSLHGIGVMKCSTKISYLTSVQCMTQVSKCYSRKLIFMDRATKESEVANFHGQATDTYAYV